MIRRLVIATALAASLGAVGASAATALPDSGASRITCVVVRPLDHTTCVNAPKVPDAPNLPKLP